MNKKQRQTLIAAVVVILLTILFWLISGGAIFTEVEVKFIWGLDLSLLISGIVSIICGILYSKFKKKSSASSLLK